MNIAVLRDPALLVARVGLGVVFIAYGWQEFTEYGLMALRRRSNRWVSVARSHICVT